MSCRRDETARSEETGGSGRDEAGRRNGELIDHLRATGSLHDAAVEGAFRRVLRHHFLPRLPLAEVYEDTAIPTRMGDDGKPISSSSQPAIMAVMLEQLALEPGQRVLEIGTGTGYNASLLSELVGPSGRVVSVDVDEEICAEAAKHLRAAGARGVQVVCSDGAAGWPPAAPYDRILLTAGSADVAPAWFDQLVPSGRLVLPLALLGPMQLSVCFRREPDRLASTSVSWCGFMPLRGELAFAPVADPGLRELLGRPGAPTEHELPGRQLGMSFEAWLSLTDPLYVGLRAEPDDVPAFGIRDGEGIAVVVRDGPRAPIVVHGDGERAARRLVAAFQSWNQRRPEVEKLRVTAYPGPASIAERPGVRVVRRPHFTFVLDWP